jgi:hypothetical protein
MRYDGGGMSERAVEISETYTLGKNQGKTRKVTVDHIPATEVTYEGETDTHLTFEVSDRIGTLIRFALASNDLPEQRISYTDPSVPLDTRPWVERYPPRRRWRNAAEAIAAGRRLF